MRERTVSISSAGKTFSFTGWKIGWVKATPELVTAVKTVKQFLTFVSGGPFQYAIAEALMLPDEYFATLRDELKAQRDLFTAGLAGLGFGVRPPQGTYFVTADISGLSDLDGTEFCRCCPTAPAWWPSLRPSSTTTRRPPAPRSGSRSASAPRS